MTDQPASPTTLDAGVETALARNHAFAATGGHEGATMFPALRLLVVTCLDPRVDPAHVLGLELGDAMVVRNGDRHRRVGRGARRVSAGERVDPALEVARLASEE